MPLTHSQIWTALDRVAQNQGLSASGLARKAGLDPTSFNPSKRQSTSTPPRLRWPSTESLTRVLSVTGLSLADFAELAQDARSRSSIIPLLGLAQAGQDGFFDDAGLPTGDGWDQTELPQAKPTLFSLSVTGDSMAPVYRPGDRVVTDRDRSDVRKGDRVVVRTLSGETLVKEVAAISAKSVTLASANPAYESRAIPRSEIDWMSRILWVSQ